MQRLIRRGLRPPQTSFFTRWVSAKCRHCTSPGEILARCAPLIETVVRAQEAALSDDPPALKEALAQIAARLSTVAHEALVKIDPNPASNTYVDPVIWLRQ